MKEARRYTLNQFWAFIPLLAMVGLLGLLGYYNFHKKPKYEPRDIIGQSLSDLRLSGLYDSEPQSLKALVQGYDKPVLINMFASWCLPCAAENPQLLALKSQGVVIIGVAWKDDPQKARLFLERHQSPFEHVLLDPNGRLAIDLGISGVPETFVVRPDGTISNKIAGPILPETVPQLLTELKAKP